jgi:hypothetical protein
VFCVSVGGQDGGALSFRLMMAGEEVVDEGEGRIRGMRDGWVVSGGYSEAMPLCFQQARRGR